MIQLAEWAQTRTDEEFVSLNPPPANAAQAWRPEMLSNEIIETIRDALVRKEPQATDFKIFLEHSDMDREKPVFIRDELIISDVKAPRVSRVRAIVIAEDSPLATLLRDAETPAHTQWNQDTSNFKNKYKFGAGALKFVRMSVTELFRIINSTENEPDPAITIDFFSMPAQPEDVDSSPGNRPVPRPQPGGDPPPPPVIPPARRRRFQIAKLRGGFGIRPGDPEAPLPSQIRVRVAYDIRRGNPLRKYNAADFDLNQPPVRYKDELKGIEITSVEKNELVFEVKDRDFGIVVTGFDPERDLYVKADPLESPDVD